MIFEKLQLENISAYISRQMEKSDPADEKDGQRLLRLKFQQEKVREWSAYLSGGEQDLPVVPIAKGEYYEPSAALKHFWIGYRYEKTHVPFNIVINNLWGQFNLEIFKRTCHTIIERHEILRTVAVFLDDARAVKQKVLPEIDLDRLLTVIDISQEKDPKKAIGHHLDLAKNHIFEYERGPYFYFTLLKCSGEEFFVIFNISHSIFDGFSKDLFEKEFSILYRAYKEGKPHGLKELPLQYKDFCKWEGEIQSKDISTAYRKYWFYDEDARYPQGNLSLYYTRTELNDVSYRDSLRRRIKPYLRDAGEETVRAFYGVVGKAERTYSRSYRVVIHGDALAGLHVLCRKRKAAVHFFIMAVWNVLIYKTTSLKSVVFGVNTATRDRAEFQTIMGFFVNTILVRNSLDGNMSFDSLLTDIIINGSIASSFKYYTLAKLLDDLDIPFNAINTIFLNVQPTTPTAALTDLSSRHSDKTMLGIFDIDLHIRICNNGIEIVCHYDTSIYQAEVIERLWDGFMDLLQKCTTNPLLPIDEIGYPDRYLKTVLSFKR
ncbi:MAG TPA: condensation domain-containing protein [Puia sp.]|nr:condensation domain-containing protein [Puia sp.]